VWYPMNPAAPVTRNRMILNLADDRIRPGRVPVGDAAGRG
jgi:hypothetical protein